MDSAGEETDGVDGVDSAGADDDAGCLLRKDNRGENRDALALSPVEWELPLSRLLSV